MGAAPVLVLLLLVAAAALPRRASAATDAGDVSAINGLYVALGSPKLPGWSASGGDPCGESWQGVTCTGSSITSIIFNAANLGGQLGSLGNFTSITEINLSNNNIGGSIPEDLPVTLQNIFLSDNQLTGSIPVSLSKLHSLTAIFSFTRSLNDNHLDGKLPDTFDSLTELVNLDISSNNFSGPLPPSLGSLTSLTTLHMQDNQLSGTLDVLQDLSLKDLNVENNMFSGPVPPKLLNIPNFKNDGNPFNTSIAPSTSPSSPTGSPTQTPSSSSSPSGSPSPSNAASNSSSGSTARNSNSTSSKKKKPSTLRTVGYVLLAIVLFIVLALLVVFCLSKYQERQTRRDYSMAQLGRHQRAEEPKSKQASVQSRHDAKKGLSEVPERKKPREINLAVPVAIEKPPEKRKEHVINLERTESEIFAAAPPPPPRLPSPPPAEKVTVNPIVRPVKRVNTPPRTGPSTSATSFSVASLQQYTNSFQEQNLIRESRLGKVYLAELPEGKLLEVMKIDNANGRIPVDDFLELVACISDIRHPNILELVGYCAEYEQRLLVYNHFSRKTLLDVLHEGEDIDNPLSWNARLQIALHAAKALEYLHDTCEPPLVHQNFDPANVLLDNRCSVRVAECGLAELMASGSVTQLSGRMRALLNYEAPEIHDSEPFTQRSDVYSFGVVMLELLTGRKPYDSSRPRAEQHLVRWADSQLHDMKSLSEMVDPSIRGECSVILLSCFADIISRCIQPGPEFRPAMSQIVQDLARIVGASSEVSE
ncbi:Putative STRUBBELIG family receptor protein kinase [Zea mays]|uniref:Putative STRUBBELIG family receptor protein kinase n=1 Tax=Zea mays TaxID=4577 RepID=A0A1D6QS33_MAIZE|nr:Putative STRUBBELIG family receptor protein kinase [Zea mays]